MEYEQQQSSVKKIQIQKDPLRTFLSAVTFLQIFSQVSHAI